MRGNTTGATLIQAGPPIVLAVLSSRADAGAAHDDALIARATEVVPGTLR